MPTRCRRGADAVATKLSRVSVGAPRGYRGVLGGTKGVRSSTGFSAVTACSSMCVRVQCACACARVLICVFGFIWVRARCIRAHMRASNRMCLCLSIGLHLRARVYAQPRCAHSHRTAGTCGIYSPARAARRRPRVRGCVRCHRPGSRASAAGATFTNRTSNAPWAARRQHASVVDAAGAIYVIGGNYGSYTLQDVWASTDRGARPD